MKQRYDIYLFDLHMVEEKVLELMEQVQNIDSAVKIMILTESNISPYFNIMVNLGVSGFISRSYSKEQLIRAVRCTAEGQAIIPTSLLRQLRRSSHKVKLQNGKNISISEKEEKILMELSKGLTNEEISRTLYMSKRTLERQLTKIYKKLQVQSRTEAITKSQKLGLIPQIILS